MPNRHKQLELIKRVTHDRVLDAQQVAIDSQQALQQNKAQLTQLLAYRGEYSTRFVDNGSQGINASQLAEYRAFLARLDQAIGAQQEAIKKNNLRWIDNRASWQKVQSHEKALDKVMEKRRADELHWQEQQEQRVSDERVLIKGVKGEG